METLRTKKDVVSSLYGNSEYVIDQQEKKTDMMKYPYKESCSFFSKFLSLTHTDLLAPSEPIKQRCWALGTGSVRIHPLPCLHQESLKAKLFVCTHLLVYLL